MGRKTAVCVGEDEQLVELQERIMALPGLTATQRRKLIEELSQEKVIDSMMEDMTADLEEL